MEKALAIKGHPTRGKEVIELLEMLGGNNKYVYDGCSDGFVYFIEKNDKYITFCGKECIKNTGEYIIYELEEVLEKYPYKVGDKVVYTKFGDNCDEYPITIESMKWTGTTIEYTFNGCVTCLAKDLKKYIDTEKKDMNDDNYQETLETKVFGYTVDDVIFTNDTGWIRITNKLWDCYAKENVYEGIGIINGYEYKDIRHHNVTGKMQLGHLKHCKDVDVVRYVNSITDDIMINQITNKVSVIKFKPDVCDNKIELHLGDYEIEVRDGKTYAVKKKPKYPTTYVECCEVLSIPSYYKLKYSTYEHDYHEYTTLKELCLLQDNLNRLGKLLICRNAYWKIAGEQMGLDKPWEPDWKKHDKKYIIDVFGDTVIYFENETYDSNTILAFPTEEMRTEFYNNFKNLIKSCKELL